MNRNDCASARRHAALEFGWIYVVGGRVNVRENGPRAKRAHGAGGGNESEWRQKDVVAGSHAARTQRKHESVCAGADADPVPNVAKSGHFLFEYSTFAAENELLRFEDAVNRGVDFRADGGVLCCEVELRNGFERGGGLCVGKHGQGKST